MASLSSSSTVSRSPLAHHHLLDVDSIFNSSFLKDCSFEISGSLTVGSIHPFLAMQQPPTKWDTTIGLGAGYSHAQLMQSSIVSHPYIPWHCLPGESASLIRDGFTDQSVLNVHDGNVSTITFDTGEGKEFRAMERPGFVSFLSDTFEGEVEPETINLDDEVPFSNFPCSSSNPKMQETSTPELLNSNASINKRCQNEVDFEYIAQYRQSHSASENQEMRDSPRDSTFMSMLDLRYNQPERRGVKRRNVLETFYTGTPAADHRIETHHIHKSNRKRKPSATTAMSPRNHYIPSDQNDIKADPADDSQKHLCNVRCTDTDEGVIHVRARRGQATDSHSLAERVRRAKISERMKLLQELVPGCSKVLGKAAVLEEIIKYVKFLQLQIDFLSMKLATTTSQTTISVKNMESFPNQLL
ncbi:hypothetical protein KP509_30G009600 [Ceratopteris richardii]|uniref:BHLH domain-containing protein n=1 Tax=Ceratopteris richardii TaxID=49495 RepID=A0A8T2R1R2_CERRI|nr:hypothetical protein KP509_30G009600 [Ceratopteris richardii]